MCGGIFLELIVGDGVASALLPPGWATCSQLKPQGIPGGHSPQESMAFLGNPCRSCGW